MDFAKKEKDRCVCLNIYVNCNKDNCDKKSACCENGFAKQEYKSDCKCDDRTSEDCCIEINVFTECEKK